MMVCIEPPNKTAYPFGPSGAHIGSLDCRREPVRADEVFSCPAIPASKVSNASIASAVENRSPHSRCRTIPWNIATIVRAMTCGLMVLSIKPRR